MFGSPEGSTLLSKHRRQRRAADPVPSKISTNATANSMASPTLVGIANLNRIIDANDQYCQRMAESPYKSDACRSNKSTFVTQHCRLMLTRLLKNQLWRLHRLLCDRGSTADWFERYQPPLMLVCAGSSLPGSADARSRAAISNPRSTLRNCPVSAATSRSKIRYAPNFVDKAGAHDRSRGRFDSRLPCLLRTAEDP